MLLESIESNINTLRESLPPPLQAYFTRTNIQLLLRVIVIISTYILFRPHLESLFRKVTGTPDRKQEEIKARLEFLKQQQDGGSGMPKNVGMLGKDGKVNRVTPQQGQGQGQQKANGTLNVTNGGGAKRRKA